MADPVVGITNGVPTSGTGTITTLGQTLVDGANATHGITTGAAVTTDVAGTFQQYLRGLVKLFASLSFTSTSMNVNITNANANVQSGAPVTVVAQTPTATANGATASRVNAAATTNATSLKATAGQLYTIDVFNAAAYNVFLKLYNKASAPTVGTDTPVMTIPIQAGGGYSKTWPMGLPFSTGIAYAITKLQPDTDTTVLVAGDLTGNTTWI
jgi:hypothetical protein